MRVTVIQHVPFEGPAVIGDVVHEREIEVDIVRVDLNMSVPAAGSVDALVVMGGPMGAFDDRDHPHLRAERDLITACVRGAIPVLGVCLGAQMLAAALDARVYRGPAPEVGIGTVQLTEAGRYDPLLGIAGPELAVLHWHQDTFELPAGATLLASSAQYPHQAFRVGSAYGLQFHIEIDNTAFAQIAHHLPPDVLIEPSAAAAVADCGRPILRQWVDDLLRTNRARPGFDKAEKPQIPRSQRDRPEQTSDPSPPPDSIPGTH
jgi:GMP synthase (glutamine-hydrolysing)